VACLHILNLSQEKLEEFLPYLDTLVVPVCSISKSVTGVPDTQDVLFVRSCAEKIDGHLSGRILVLPEVVHTKIMVEESVTDQEPEVVSASSVLAEFLLAAIRPYSQMGFSNIVFVYSEGTDSDMMEGLLPTLTETGLQAAAFQLNSSTQIDRLIVPEIISLWSKKSTNS
jgi:creatinine amidohydrolase